MRSTSRRRGTLRSGTSSGGGGGGGGTPTPAAFPSRLTVSANHFVDSNGYDIGVLKGFNTNLGNLSNTAFNFSQAHYDAQRTLTDAAAVAGPGIVRQVIHWNAFEQSNNVFHGITSPTSAATVGSAFDSLDRAIARAGLARSHSLLEIHVNSTGSGATGTVPTWARTGTFPTGAGSEWSWLITNGQNFVQTLAERYNRTFTNSEGGLIKKEFTVAVNPNEPPAILIPQVQNGYDIFVPWYRSIAPEWVIWMSVSGYGNGTPYPTSGTQIDVPRMMALDINGVGVCQEFHDYLDSIGTYSTNGYQPNGTGDPVQQIGVTGSHFHGFDHDANSARSAARDTAYAAHVAWAATLKAAAGPKLALAAMEFGRDNQLSNSAEQIYDKIKAFRNAGFSAECWWQYGVNQTVFDSGSTTGGGAGFRPEIVAGWINNTTLRA